MLVVIAFISINVNVYSVDFLESDTHQEHFMWVLAIFAVWITVFVMSNNLIVLFFCWELVGLCSYLLISFWKERQHSLKCGFKAILYNKVGDIGLLLLFGSTLEVVRTIDLVPGITLLPYFKSLGHY
jgi:NADH-quinone oxidoreductase subunit L